MKRCPECRRDYYDETLLYCLDDGTALLEGPASADGPETAILERRSSEEIGPRASRARSLTSTDPTGLLKGADEESRIGLGARSSGLKRLPIRVLVGVGICFLLVTGAVFGYRYFLTASSKQIDSIVVLPFQNIGGDANTEYLSDGITETLINNFTKISALRVIARSTAFRYKGKDLDPQGIGKDLNVSAILTGKILQRGDSLNIQVDLVNAATGAEIWGEQYNGKASDILDTQQKIARDVSERLRLNLTGVQEQEVAKRYTHNPEAYQLYLKGRYYWNKRTGEDINQSVGYFQQAIEKDPNYALAYSGLADAYSLLAIYDVAPSAEVFPKAKEAARRALELDDSLAEAHTSLASVLDSYDWKFAEAEGEYRRAIVLNPNYGTAHQWLSELLSNLGRHDAAIDEMKRAQQVDPLSLIINADLGKTYELAGQYDEAIAQLKRTIAMDRNFSAAHDFLSSVYEDKGMFEEAVYEGQAAAILHGINEEDSARIAAAILQAYHTGGAKGYWQRAVELTVENAKRRYVPPYNFAVVEARAGDKERMYDWLEKAFDEHGKGLNFIKVEPAFGPYYSEPRFQDLVRRIGLPQ